VLSVWREPDDILRQARNLPSLTTDEKLSYWNTEGSDAPDIPVEKPEESMLIVRENKAPHSPLFTETGKFLIGSKAYQWLLERIRADSVLARTGTTADFIRDVIRNRLLADQVDRLDEPHTTTFEIFWSPLRFLREQNYQQGEYQAIGEVITLTGSAVDAQAMTCAQYIHQTWPMTGDETLWALQAAMTKIPNHRHQCIWLISRVCISLRAN
jgi:hypothetical protein